MRAVFIHKHCVLRDSHIDPASPPDAWRLMPATLEAIRTLGSPDTLVLLWSCHTATADTSRREQPSGGASGLDVLVKQVEAGGGRIDALITCEHDAAGQCKCWGEYPGAVWAAAVELDLTLHESYVLADGQLDIATAYAAGMRPILVLCDRTIGQILGDLPPHSGFPIATDLTSAVSYIGVEQDIARQLGRPRTEATPLPANGTLYANRAVLPTIRVLSPLAQGVQTRLRKSRVQLRDLTRWLTLFVLGALGLSLGIAYLLTHLYRQAPLPDFAYYISLQFIPRLARGALFTAWGVGVIVLAVRSFYRSADLNLWPKRRR
jgi:histidinol phosphatase-like enzyme